MLQKPESSTESYMYESVGLKMLLIAYRLPSGWVKSFIIFVII